MPERDPKAAYALDTEAAESLSCPFGEIRLFFDGMSVPFALFDKLPASPYAQQFTVDANKRLCWHYESDGRFHILRCRLVPAGPYEWDYDSGECLQAIEVFDDATTLTIATRWDYWDYARNGSEGVEDYLVREVEDGLQFLFDESTRSHDIIIGVSWLSGYTYDTRVNPWYAGDPGMDEL